MDDDLSGAGLRMLNIGGPFWKWKRKGKGEDGQIAVSPLRDLYIGGATLNLNYLDLKSAQQTPTPNTLQYSS